MIKMPTLFKKDPNDLGRVIDELACPWVNDEWVTLHRKWDGTSCMIKDGSLYKRYDAKLNKKTGKMKVPPDGSIACCEPDPITGHHPHWAPVLESDKYHLEAFALFSYLGANDGTYELCGPKINGNHENLDRHVLFSHDGSLYNLRDYSYKNMSSCLSVLPQTEGFVFHHPDGRMCKIRRKDFGLDWPIKSN